MSTMRNQCAQTTETSWNKRRGRNEASVLTFMLSCIGSCSKCATIISEILAYGEGGISKA